MLNSCTSCKYDILLPDVEPCASCSHTNWEPNEPSPEPAEVFIRWNQESIERQRCNLLKNSVPGSDIKPGRPSPYLVGAKKSKWHRYPDVKPKEGKNCLRYGSSGYFRDRYENGRWYSEADEYTHWRYMPKPPKEYRK